MLGVSCSPFSIATLFITPFSALGIWHAVHPGKCQQYGICYTYWSWYTVENNGPNFKRHGAKNRACCNTPTVNPPWMSCLKTKKLYFLLVLWLWFVFRRCRRWKILRSDEYGLDLLPPDAGTTGSAGTRGLSCPTAGVMGGGWARGRRRGTELWDMPAPCLAAQGCPCEARWGWAGMRAMDTRVWEGERGRRMRWWVSRSHERVALAHRWALPPRRKWARARRLLRSP